MEKKLEFFLYWIYIYICDYTGVRSEACRAKAAFSGMVSDRCAETLNPIV